MVWVCCGVVGEAGCGGVRLWSRGRRSAAGGGVVDLEEFRDKSRQTWDSVAQGWEARGEFLERTMGLVNDWIIDQVDPQSGQVVLEVAAGPGDLGFRIAELVAPGGRVISTDFAAEMVAVARRWGAERGLDNVEFRQLDAEDMDLADDSVDAVVCRAGYMLMGDPGAAFAESRRVLRGSGTLAFQVFSTPDQNPWASVAAATLVQRGQMPPPQPGAPGPFALGDPERIRDLLGAAGFTDVEVEAVEFVFGYADADDAWDAILDLNGPMAAVIESLSDEERSATRDAVIDAYSPHRQADGSYAVPARAWCVVAG